MSLAPIVPLFLYWVILCYTDRSCRVDSKVVPYVSPHRKVLLELTVPNTNGLLELAGLFQCVLERPNKLTRDTRSYKDQVRYLSVKGQGKTSFTVQSISLYTHALMSHSNSSFYTGHAPRFFFAVKG